MVEIGVRPEKILKRPLDSLDTGPGYPSARFSLSILFARWVHAQALEGLVLAVFTLPLLLLSGARIPRLPPASRRSAP